MKPITSVILATVITTMSVLGILENADANHNYRRCHTTTHVRCYRTCTGINRYKVDHCRYYRSRYYRSNRRHH
jgi:hypothetical protein